MSSLFTQTTPLTSGSIEATVQSVDVARWVCTVKTTKGQRYNNVIWGMPSGGSGRSGVSFTPKMGDRVKLSTGLGYPVIESFLPRIDRDPVSPISIDTGSAIGDTGKLTPLEGTSFNSGKAGDQVAGDHIISSEGGGFMAVLRGGTVMMKASSLAQVLVSKLDDLARIVGRSTEIISEVGVEIFASVKGTAYKYVAYAASPAEARLGLFRYTEYYGDTQTAEALKDTYELGSAGGSVSPGGPLKKILVVDAAGLPLRVETTDSLGNVSTTTKTADGVSSSVVNYSNGQWDLTTTNGTYCNIKVTNAEISMTYNGDASVVINDLGVTSKKGSTVSKVLVDSILLDNAAGHFVHILPSGVQMG